MELVGIMSPQCGNHQAPNISQPHLFNFFNWETLTLYTDFVGDLGRLFFLYTHFQAGNSLTAE